MTGDQGGFQLTAVQRDILELEGRTWARRGEKRSEFRTRHPGMSETDYYVVLLQLLRTPEAYQVEGGRYAGLLSRLDTRYRQQLRARMGTRVAAAQVPAV